MPSSRRRVSVPVATVWSAPDAPRPGDALAVADRPDVAAWASSMDGAVRRGLHGRCETQLLLGEEVLVLDEVDSWSRVVATGQPCHADARGYPGWVRTAHLGDGRPPYGREAVVSQPSCVYAGHRAGPLTLSFGTVVQVLDHEEPVASVALGDGQRGALPRAALRDQPAGDPTAGSEAVLEAARQFLGLPYLWGGTSAWGLDCSGLVHLVLRSFGVLLPRDADDQAACRSLPPVPLDAVLPGDLYFFAVDDGPVSHVGFATSAANRGERRMLHAPEEGAGIEEVPLPPHRLGTLVAARRPPLRG